MGALSSPGVRKLALTAHVVSSVGWLGAVLAFLPPAVTGLIRQDTETVRATYQAMELLGWYALVPLALYRVLFKLVIAATSTLILLSCMQDPRVPRRYGGARGPVQC